MKHPIPDFGHHRISATRTRARERLVIPVSTWRPRSQQILRTDALSVGSPVLGAPTLGQKRAPEMPLLQIELEHRETGEKTILLLAPADVPAFFAGQTLDFAGALPIDQLEVHRLAKILGTEPNQEFNLIVHDAVIGAVLMIIRGWHSPRWLRNFLDRLAIDPEATIAAARNDSFATFIVSQLIETVQIDAADPLSAVRARGQFLRAVKEARATISEAIRPGAPRAEVRQMFFEHVTSIAYRYGKDRKLRLPQRDPGRAGVDKTPLFAFASSMRDLLIAYGETVTSRRGVRGARANQRFDDFARLRRGDLIAILEKTRKTILREAVDFPQGSRILSSPSRRIWRARVSSRSPGP